MQITPIDVLLLVIIVVSFRVLQYRDLRRAVFQVFGLVFAGLITINYFERVGTALSDKLAIPAAYVPTGVYVLMFLGCGWVLRRVVACCPESQGPLWITGWMSTVLTLASALLASAILLSALHVLPLPLARHGFSTESEKRGPLLRRLPVDHLWLEYVQYASRNVFHVENSRQFRVRSDGNHDEVRPPFTGRFDVLDTGAGPES